MNTSMLLDKIESSGISKSEIAETLGITRQGLYNKLCGKKEFKASEVRKLSELLDLTSAEREQIFFADWCRRKRQQVIKEGVRIWN